MSGCHRFCEFNGEALKINTVYVEATKKLNKMQKITTDGKQVEQDCIGMKKRFLTHMQEHICTAVIVIQCRLKVRMKIRLVFDVTMLASNIAKHSLIHHH